MVDVNIRGVLMSGASWVVLLENPEDERTLPIAIGAAEAQSILLELNGIEFPRPLTHDLFRQILLELGVTLTRVDITELRDETFFAKITLEHPSGTLVVDARPSDALALALRFSAPVRVADAVMDAAGIVVSEMIETESGPEEDDTDDTDPLRDLKQQLADAVAHERYEEAAVLRDRINQAMCRARRREFEAESEEDPMEES